MSVWDDTDALTAKDDYLSADELRDDERWRNAVAEEYAEAESFDEHYGDEIEGRAEHLEAVPESTPAPPFSPFTLARWSLMGY